MKKKPIVLNNPHPGAILLEEFLIPLGMSQYDLAKRIGLSGASVNRIIKGDQPITADTAIRLSKLFGTSAKIWIGLQVDYDLEEAEKKGVGSNIKKVTKKSLVKRSRMLRKSRGAVLPSL